MAPLKAVTVFCGSSLGKNPAFEKSAKTLGECLAKREIELIYGGGTVGLMGTVAKSVKDDGGKGGYFFKGSEFFFPFTDPVFLESVGKLVIVEDMHTRKREMLEKADALIALPGGFGTLEELLEMITWRQLGLHKKPIGILNIGGYFDKFLEWMKEAMTEGFIRPDASPHPVQISAVSDNCEELLLKLEQCVNNMSNEAVHHMFNNQ